VAHAQRLGVRPGQAARAQEKLELAILEQLEDRALGARALILEEGSELGTLVGLASARTSAPRLVTPPPRVRRPARSRTLKQPSQSR
jgi:hypothetical protein